MITPKSVSAFDYLLFYLLDCFYDRMFLSHVESCTAPQQDINGQDLLDLAQPGVSAL